MDGYSIGIILLGGEIRLNISTLIGEEMINSVCMFDSSIDIQVAFCTEYIISCSA